MRSGYTYVTARTTTPETPAVINDTAYILSYNGYDLGDNRITSDTLYHEIVAIVIPDPTGVRTQIAAVAGFGGVAVLGLGAFIIWSKKSKKKLEDEGGER